MFYEETTNTRTVNLSMFDSNCNVNDLFFYFWFELGVFKRNSLLSQIERRSEDTILNVILRERFWQIK
jgi:hypothetical protein